MTWSMTTWAKLIVATALVLAAFFFAPVVDAATCLPEPPAAHAVIDHDQDAGDHSGPAGAHGVCAHGHCHHSSTARTQGIDLALAPAFGAPLPLSGRQDDFRASITPDGLKRPPRV